MGHFSQSVPKNSSTFAPDFRNEVRCNFFLLIRESFETCVHTNGHSIKAKHKTFNTMSKINFDVIDQMFAAQLSANESEETIKALRPQVEEAVKELIWQQGKPKNWTGTLEYHGFKIVVSRPKSYTWEQNTQLNDPSLDYYKQLHKYYTDLQENVKEARADLKRSAEKLAKEHPDSESIKRGFRLAFLTA